MSPFVKYLLWQIPGWVGGLLVLGTGAALGVPLWLAWTLFAGWVTKDLLLYPAMRSTFRLPEATHPIGAQAEAVERLAPRGYVRVNGELWQARTQGPAVEPGRCVIVRAASGLTLIVEAVDRPVDRDGHDR